MWIFPHQQTEKSLQNQHVLSILQVGSHQLQYRFFRTRKPKSRYKTNTFCPITPTPHPAPPFNHLTNPALIHATTTTVPASTHAKTPPANAEGARNHIHFDPVSCKSLVVELTGLEPVTPCLQSRCATNCAIAP